MSGNRSRRHPPELPEHAVRMVPESVSNTSRSGRRCPGAQSLGVRTAETVRQWVRQGQVDNGARLGTTSEEPAQRKLRRENAELKRANVILKAS